MRSWCNCSSWRCSWCCWWKWCLRASLPRLPRSPSPRRSPTRAARAHDANRKGGGSYATFFHSSLQHHDIAHGQCCWGGSSGERLPGDLIGPSPQKLLPELLWVLWSGEHRGLLRQPEQLVLEQLLLEQLEVQLVVEVVLPSISSRASTRSRTSKVSDSKSSSSPRRPDR